MSNKEMFGPEGEHDHQWGDFQWSAFGGSYHRPCTIAGCRFVTLDSDDNEDED